MFARVEDQIHGQYMENIQFSPESEELSACACNWYQTLLSPPPRAWVRSYRFAWFKVQWRGFLQLFISCSYVNPLLTFVGLGKSSTITTRYQNCLRYIVTISYFTIWQATYSIQKDLKIDACMVFQLSCLDLPVSLMTMHIIKSTALCRLLVRGQ